MDQRRGTSSAPRDPVVSRWAARSGPGVRWPLVVRSSASLGIRSTARRDWCPAPRSAASSWGWGQRLPRGSPARTGRPVGGEACRGSAPLWPPRLHRSVQRPPGLHAQPGPAGARTAPAPHSRSRLHTPTGDASPAPPVARVRPTRRHTSPLHTTPAACELPASFACRACLAISVPPGRRPADAHGRRRLRQMCNRASTLPTSRGAAVTCVGRCAGHSAAARTSTQQPIAPVAPRADAGPRRRPPSGVRDRGPIPGQCRLSAPVSDHATHCRPAVHDAPTREWRTAACPTPDPQPANCGRRTRSPPPRGSVSRGTAAVGDRARPTPQHRARHTLLMPRRLRGAHARRTRQHQPTASERCSIDDGTRGRLPRSSASLAGLRHSERPQSSLLPARRSVVPLGDAARADPSVSGSIACTLPSPVSSGTSSARHIRLVQLGHPDGISQIGAGHDGARRRFRPAVRCTWPVVRGDTAGGRDVRCCPDSGPGRHRRPRASPGRACACPWSVRGATGRHGRHRSAALMRTCGDARRHSHHPRPQLRRTSDATPAGPRDR